MIRKPLRRKRLKLGALAVAVAPFVMAPLFAPQVALAQDGAVRLSPAQMQEAAKLAVQSGDTARAIAFADALLTRDPQDVNAHLIRAYALRTEGRFDASRLAARSGWRYAQNDTQRFNAALLVAQALSSDGKRTRAQLWLRRAVEHAPSPGHANRAKRDFKYVQRQNPWQTYLSFTLAPNNNINNGSARESYYSDSVFDIIAGESGSIIPINPEAQALSGLEIGAQVQTRYRFHQTERRAHDLRFGLSYRTYTLSSNSRDRVPDAKGSDYAYGTVSLGYGFSRLRADRRGEFRLNTDLGQSFYAGSRYATYLRSSASQSYYVDRRTKLNFGATAETENGQRVSDSESLNLSFGVDRAIAGGNGLHLGVTLRRQVSDNSVHDYSQIRVRAGYVLGRKTMGARWRFGVGARLRDYEVFPLDVDGRRDLEISFDATATFEDVDYYGFTPQVSLIGSVTNSNIGFYDSNRLGLNIGIVSAF